MNRKTDFKYGNRFNAGVSFNFHINDWVAVTNDLNYFSTGKGEQQNLTADELYTKWVLHTRQEWFSRLSGCGWHRQ
ncbi:MAG: hypothetical protein R2744_08180 [Bacteroidales bacterium]